MDWLTYYRSEESLSNQGDIGFQSDYFMEMQINETLQRLIDPKKTPHCFYGNIPSFVAMDHTTSRDSQETRWNAIYDKIAPFYERTEIWLGKLLTGTDMKSEWRAIAHSAKFQKSQCILEVSPGPGNYQSFLLETIGPEGTLVSLDLSIGMLQACERKQSTLNNKALLVHGNGSALPFKDEAFDGLFHIGGINLFANPVAAIREFTRVVKPGGTVVIGDEGFAPNLPNSWRKKMLSRLNPGFKLSKIPELPGNLEQMAIRWYMGGYLFVQISRRTT